MGYRLFFILFGVLFFMLFPMPASSSPSAQAEGVSVRIISAPPAGGGHGQLEPIKVRVQDPQKVCGEEFVDCRVALFTYADRQWYPQPFLDRQVVEIGGDGLVSEKVHLGSRYGALIVLAERYPLQGPQLHALPLDYALANAETEAGEKTTEPSAEWIGNLIFGPVGLVIILILLFSLFLGLSDKLGAFCNALEFTLPKLIEVPASRLRELKFTIQRTEGETRLKFIAAAICFPLAIVVAVVNFHIVRFSLELSLTEYQGALTFLAAALVALKGASGMLLHVLKSRLVRFVIVFLLLAACVVGAFLAYRRAEAMQEDKRIAPVSAAAPESGVMINEGVLGNLTATNAPAPQPDPSSAGSLLVGLFSKEPIFVAALAVILDLFEIICIYGAFHSSASAIIWLLTLPLTIANEVFGFVKETQLMNVIAIFATATLTALNTLITGAARVIRELSVAAMEGGKKIAASIRESCRKLRDYIKRWKERKIERENFLYQLRIRESEKIMEEFDRWSQTEEQRQSTRAMKQEEHKFNQSELRQNLEHREQMNKELRDTATSALVTNLDKMAALARLIGDKLMAEAGKRADEYCEAQGTPLAEGTTEAVAFQAEVMNKMGRTVNGFYPSKTPRDKGA